MCKHSLFLVCKKQCSSAFQEFAALNVDVGCLIRLFSSRNWERCMLIAPAECRIWRWWRRRQRGIVNKSILRNVLATQGFWKFLEMIFEEALVQDNCNSLSCACSGVSVQLIYAIWHSLVTIAGSNSLPNCFVRLIVFQALKSCDNVVPRGVPKICSPITCCTVLSVRYQALERDVCL
jgi:hypothetical protein